MMIMMMMMMMMMMMVMTRIKKTTHCKRVPQKDKWKASFHKDIKGAQPYSSYHDKCPIDVSPRTQSPTHRNLHSWYPQITTI